MAGGTPIRLSTWHRGAVHDNSQIVENRVNRVLSERIMPTEIHQRVALEVTASHLPGEPVGVTELDLDAFRAVAPGDRWGPPWGTTWFSVSGTVLALDDPPAAEGLGVEVKADIGFTGAMAGFQAEAAVYVDNLIRCGVHPRRRSIPLEVVTDGDRIEFLLEAAANPDFASSFTPNPLGDRSTSGTSPLYVFRGVDLVSYHRQVRELIREFSTLNQIMRALRKGTARRTRLTAILGRALDSLDMDDVPATARQARHVLAEGFAPGAADDAHHLTAVGHAHIDTAWLWPIRETRRKAARTFANQVQLMERYPEHIFVCSQAAQYEFIEEDHPELFDEIRERASQGQWIPVGGMWVEADMNLPNGESLVRQIVAGQRYFEEHFGARCDEVWIPDVFGYPGSLPQIFREGGFTRFLTQKLSWNKQNRFPHHSFTWEGIDGSTVVAHFPPVETYNSELSPAELIHASANFSDHAWSDHSLVPFGYGDGGGGPTADMLERARLLADTAGLPHLSIRQPTAFFEDLEAELARPGTPRWRGELYFEMHRGTLTSQTETKLGNRRCEGLLREVELWAATLGDNSHRGELDRLWKRVLIQQFHDIIPGSSIAWVHHDAEAEHAAVAERLEEILSGLIARINPEHTVVINSATHPRGEVVAVPASPNAPGSTQQLADGSHVALVAVPGMGTSELVTLATTDAVEASANSLRNGLLEVTFNETGAVGSVVDRRIDRELVPAGMSVAQLQIATDQPVEFDAWDLESWTAPGSVPVPAADSITVTERGPLVGEVQAHYTFGASSATQTYRLTADSARLDITMDVAWAEDEKYLSLYFPLDIRSETAECEVQFGHVSRPTHASSSWDAAKFEVAAHRWVDLSEPRFGVALLNNGRYGYSVQEGGIRISLLRAPSYPDPTADRGHHRVTVSLLPHGPGLAEVLSQAEALNTPLRVRPPASAPEQEPPSLAVTSDPVCTLADPRIAVSAVKLADDGSGDLVVRMWEATGDRVRTTLELARPALAAFRTNLMEEPYGDGHPQVVAGVIELEMRPFELLTLRIERQPER